MDILAELKLLSEHPNLSEEARAAALALYTELRAERDAAPSPQGE